MLWDPIRFLESCPSSDGACAMVLTDESRRRGGRRSRRRGSLGDRDAQRARHVPGPRPGAPAGRRRLRRTTCTARPGSRNPRQEIDVAELYVPFSWYEPMWLEGHDIAGPGEGWKMVDDGDDRARRARSR